MWTSNNGLLLTTITDYSLVVLQLKKAKKETTVLRVLKLLKNDPIEFRLLFYNFFHFWQINNECVVSLTAKIKSFSLFT